MSGADTMELVSRTTVRAIVGARDASMKKIKQASASLKAGFIAAAEANDLAHVAHGGAPFYLVDHAAQKAWADLFHDFNAEASIEAFRRSLDARCWMLILSMTGMLDRMDVEARKQLEADLSGDVTPVTEDNIYQTVKRLAEDSKLIFQRGLANVFSSLDERFRSHDAFRFKDRAILGYIFDSDGYFNGHTHATAMLGDVERVFAVLDGVPPLPGELVEAIRADRPGFGCRQSVTETRFFRVKGYKNGNAHLWFTRKDLVDKVNQVLAEYYGEVLPDAVPKDLSPDDVRSKTGLPSKDLAYYPTPRAVVATMMGNVALNRSSRVLEPSAGTGAIVSAALEADAHVTAVEVHPGRAAQIERLCDVSAYRLRVISANFLNLPATPEYTDVLMNPPFAGTHWMQHVMHAFDFLQPGGQLLAVLPATAKFGESKAHEKFHAWLSGQYRYWFRHLPQASFASSGTNVSTVLLMVRKALR